MSQDKENKIAVLKQYFWGSKLKNYSKFVGGMNRADFFDILNSIHFNLTMYDEGVFSLEEDRARSKAPASFDIKEEYLLELSPTYWAVLRNSQTVVSGNDYDLDLDYLDNFMLLEDKVGAKVDFIVKMAKHLENDPRFYEYIGKLGEYWLDRSFMPQKQNESDKVIRGFLDTMEEYYSQESSNSPKGNIQPE